MEAVLSFLDREAKVYNNAAAAIILADYRRTKRMLDVDFYAISHMKKAARERDVKRAAKIAAQVAAKKAKDKLAEREALRDRIRRKLGSPL